MDDFDQLNVSNPETEASVIQQEDDLLGSDFTANPVATKSNNVFDNDSTTQQPDLSWITDDVKTNDFLPVVDRYLFLVASKCCYRNCTTKKSILL